MLALSEPRPRRTRRVRRHPTTRVLCAHQEEETRLLVQLHLEAAGFGATTSEDGLTARNLLQSATFDVAVAAPFYPRTAQKLRASATCKKTASFAKIRAAPKST